MGLTICDIPEPHEIVSDGTTVWVNIGEGCLARFGPRGIDVHQRPSEVARGGRECLHCTHEPTTAADWEVFVAKCLSAFGIEVGEEHRPASAASPPQSPPRPGR